MTPKWGCGVAAVAMLPVRAVCFYQVHFERTVLPKRPLWAHRLYSVVYSVSEFRRACFRQARVARAVLPPGALFRARGFAFPPCASQVPHAPAPTFRGWLRFPGACVWLSLHCQEVGGKLFLHQTMMAHEGLLSRRGLCGLAVPCPLQAGSHGCIVVALVVWVCVCVCELLGVKFPGPF